MVQLKEELESKVGASAKAMEQVSLNTKEQVHKHGGGKHGLPRMLRRAN
jgi:hypothetical protein